MKTFKISILFVFLLFLSITQVSAKKLNAVFSYATFYTVTDGPFVETYLLVNGKSVQYTKKENNLFQAVIEVTMIFKQKDSVITFKKYELLSPETADTSKIEFSFLDQQRILIPNGEYDLELIIADKNASDKPYENIEKVLVNFEKNKLALSDIELIDSMKKTEKVNILSKAGYDIIPYIINYFPKNIEKLSFYVEIYNALTAFGKDEPYIINYFIESWETQLPLSKFNRIKRETSKETNVIIGEFPLKELPSGNYNLVVAIKDKNNEIKASNKLFFYRSNPDYVYSESDILNIEVANLFVANFHNVDTLKDYIQSLHPISTEIERLYAQNNFKRGELLGMQKYFYSFWQTRNPSNPEETWRKYAEEVKKVNKSFGTGNRKGYETDRGRVYLQYGAPNSIAVNENEPSAYPYEIWHYYTLRNQTNRRFVFYTNEFATNDYELIHSDAVGEINDPRWQIKIHKRDTPTNSVDPEDAQKHWGGRIDDYYKNPR